MSFGDEDAVAHGADVGLEAGEGAAAEWRGGRGGRRAGRRRGCGLKEEFDVDGIDADGRGPGTRRRESCGVFFGSGDGGDEFGGGGVEGEVVGLSDGVGGGFG